MIIDTELLPDDAGDSLASPEIAERTEMSGTLQKYGCELFLL
jgi:hypothetical protein